VGGLGERFYGQKRKGTGALAPPRNLRRLRMGFVIEKR